MERNKIIAPFGVFKALCQHDALPTKLFSRDSEMLRSATSENYTTYNPSLHDKSSLKSKLLKNLCKFWSHKLRRKQIATSGAAIKVGSSGRL